MNRAKISNYINKSIGHFQKKERAAESRSERRRFAKTVRAHESFLDKFESTSGNSTERIIEASEARKSKKMLAGAALGAIGPAIVVGSGLGLLPFIGLAGFLGCVAGLGAGVAALALADYNESKFTAQVQLAERNVKGDAKPDPEFGNVQVLSSGGDSDSDDGFGELGISITGKPGSAWAAG